LFYLVWVLKEDKKDIILKALPINNLPKIVKKKPNSIKI
jgi:hypothetical protein